MTELEQRLTNEFGKLAEQYAEDQRRLVGQVERLEEQVQQLADQHASELKEYVGWSEHMGEQHGRLNAGIVTLSALISIW